MKKYLLLIICILSLQDTESFPPKENYYSVGSDFLVLQNPESTAAAPPQIYALYPNTVISFDINNDGVYDYGFTVASGGPYNLNTSWQISDGTKIHSNKPIQYVQQIYLLTANANYVGKTFKEDRLLTVPPIENFGNETILRNGTWYILSDSNANISVDTNADGTTDSSFIINKSTKTLNVNKTTRLFSDKKFISYSTNGFGGLLLTDFLSNENKTTLIILENNTIISYDYNIDGVIDSTSTLNRGEYNLTLPRPSRIISNKYVSAFAYVDGLPGGTVHTKSYFPLSSTSSVSNEFSVGINNDFIYGPADRGHFLIGVFNNESAENISSNFDVFDEDNLKLTGYSNFTTGKIQTLGTSNGLFIINSSVPLIDYAFYHYNSGAYIRYYIGHTIAYKKVYMTTAPKTKIISSNSSVIINSRVFNPFKDTTVSNIIIKFPINSAFSMQLATVNGRKLSLNTDGVVETFSKAVTLVNDGAETYFLFSYDNILEPETYLDLDFSLLTPSVNGVNQFSQSTLTYNAQTWII